MGITLFGAKYMLDIKEIRKNPEFFETKLKTKNPEIEISPILALDEQVRYLKTQVEEYKARKNHISKEIGLKKGKGEEFSNELASLSEKITANDHQIREQEEKLHHALSVLPNIPLDDIPISPSPKDNVCIKEVGEKRTFSFPFKNHVELNEKLKLFDFERATKISGSGWPLYTGFGARLEWALLNYMLDTHRKNGFTQVIPPLLVKPEIMYGAGQLPKFEQQLFKINDKDYHLLFNPDIGSCDQRPSCR